MVYLLGCDVGTGGAKSVIIDETGTVLGSHFVEYPLHTPRPGIAEQNPEDFWQATAETMRVSIDSAGIKASDIAGVALSAQSPGIILVDKDRQVLRPVHIWMDRRATEQCRWIKEHVDLGRIRAVSGNDIVDPYFGLTKLMWERDNEPDLYGRAVKSLNQKDFVVMRLCGEMCTDPANAALIGIAYDIKRADWDADLLREVGIQRDKLPDVRRSDERIGSVTREAAALSGLMEGTPVINGTMDGTAAWLSMGMIDPGDSVLTLGSSAIWAVAHSETVSVPGLLTLENMANPGTYITGAATSSGGALLRWFRDEFGGLEKIEAGRTGANVYDLLTAQAAAVSPGSEGLVVLPYFMGERMPIWDCSARGVFFGLSLLHTRGHIVRAIMEGVAYSVYHSIKLARDHGVPTPKPVAMVEGGASSPLWRQMISDVCDVDTMFMDGAQGAPFGDAVLAGVGLGVFPDFRMVKGWLNYSHRTEPDPERRTRYAQLFDLYLRLYESLRPRYEELAAIYAPASPGTPPASSD